jgi:hypothetical protein
VNGNVLSNFTRREILAAFLGVPVALAACRRSTNPPLPQGEIVGQSDDFGHRLRDGLRVEVPAGAWTDVPVVIVGGGVAGLSAAWHLQRSGFENFVLLELEPAPGGTSRSGSNSQVSFPWGAHYIPAPMKDNTALISLLDEMGVLEGKDREGEPIVAEQFGMKDCTCTPVRAPKMISRCRSSMRRSIAGFRGAMQRAGVRLRCRCRRVQTMQR